MLVVSSSAISWISRSLCAVTRAITSVNGDDFDGRLLELLREQLVARLERELPREVERVYARARAYGSVPSRQLAEAQAFINLHTRGRRAMVALEKERQHFKQLMAKMMEWLVES